MTQPSLPLWRVLFVDWHGVLSNDPYWASILNRRIRKGLRAALEQRLVEIFEEGGELSDEWMRGRLATSSLFACVNETLTRRERNDFLERRIVHDCMNMVLDPDLVKFLRRHLETLRVILATDNTEEFEQAFRAARSSQRRAGRRHNEEVVTLRDVAPSFDGILCSSSRGVLKSEDVERFFGDWLEENGLTFADSMLIDDREDNCAAFRSAGGNAIRWNATSPDAHADSMSRLTVWVEALDLHLVRPRLQKFKVA